MVDSNTNSVMNDLNSIPYQNSNSSAPSVENSNFQQPTSSEMNSNIDHNSNQSF